MFFLKPYVINMKFNAASNKICRLRVSLLEQLSHRKIINNKQIKGRHQFEFTYLYFVELNWLFLEMQ